MPYRYFLLPVLVITVVYFFWSYSSSEPNAYILIPLVVLGVGIFIFQNQINDFWYDKFRIDLDTAEKKWLLEYCPSIQEMNENARSDFFQLLAKTVSYHEFIPMGPEKIHEEIKWMVLIPAVQLRINHFKDLYKRFTRTALYAHPFMTPQQDWGHVSEHNYEDGLLILSIEQLKLSFFAPNQYFNPALYEWSCILVEFKGIHFEGCEEFVLELANTLCPQGYEGIKSWLGQDQINSSALVLYSIVNKPKSLVASHPEWIEQFNKLYSA